MGKGNRRRAWKALANRKRDPSAWGRGPGFPKPAGKHRQSQHARKSGADRRGDD